MINAHPLNNVHPSVKRKNLFYNFNIIRLIDPLFFVPLHHEAGGIGLQVRHSEPNPVVCCDCREELHVVRVGDTLNYGHVGRHQETVREKEGSVVILWCLNVYFIASCATIGAVNDEHSDGKQQYL